MKRIYDIYDRSSRNEEWTNLYKVITDSNVMQLSTSTVLKNIPTSLKESANLKMYTDEEAAAEDSDTFGEALDTLITPPSTDYTTIIPESAQSTADAADQMVTTQLVQQFYETYMAPTGLKEVYNRIGEIAGNIEDLHALYPNGLKGIMASDAHASWKTHLNFVFTVDEGLTTKSGTKVSPKKFSSLAFPPFIPHETVDINDYTENEEATTEEEAASDTAFDMNNLLYKRGQATYRFPAFKAVNDNINFVQKLWNASFGYEPTYITEWDLSMYMQEGLLNYIERTSGTETVKLPQFVTTLTYGLLDDAPVSELLNQTGYVDLPTIETFASVNMAVSSRYGVDTESLSESCCDQEYEVSKYPLSAYWFPSTDGGIDSDWNVSDYYLTMLGFTIGGEAWVDGTEDQFAYTPYDYHGDLETSTEPFLNVLKYTDNRNAILTGWNSTDESGKKYKKNANITNGNESNSNAYSYLPFWKQFYTSSDDGMSDIDKYAQEVSANGTNKSWIDYAADVISIVTSSNDTFNDKCDELSGSSTETSENSDDADYNNDSSNNEVDGGESDYSFSLFKCKLTIKGSRLLKMFLKKSQTAKKAQAAAQKSGSVSSPTSSAMSTANTSKATGTPVTTIGDDGQPVTTQTYTVTEPDAISTKTAEGCGIAEFSPMLFGGPVGKYLSPQTLEGYTQISNRNLATVPTCDNYVPFTNSYTSTGKLGSVYSKNYKFFGSYIDFVTAATPNERYTIMTYSNRFGVANTSPNNWTPVHYTSSWYTRHYFDDSREYYTIRTWFYTFRIPKFWLWKIRRYSNWGWQRWYNYSYSTTTRGYSTRSRTVRWENVIPCETDWINTDFVLLPVSASSVQANNGDSGTIGTNINNDTAIYTRLTDEDSWTPKKDGLKCSTSLVYQIMPNYQNATASWFNGNCTRSYAAVGSTWFEQLHHMWITGTRQFYATLPIRNRDTTEVLNYVCGVVSLNSEIVYTKQWVLHKELRLFSRRVRHCFFHRRRVWYWRWVYWWTYDTIATTVYTAHFFPDRIRWNLPTPSLIAKESYFNDSYRDDTSSDIVARWRLDKGSAASADASTATDATIDGTFESIGTGVGRSPDLFPFTRRFMNKYGIATWRVIPGTSSDCPGYDGIPVLHSKGFYYGDMLNNLRDNGSVQCISKTERYTKTWEGTVGYIDTRESSGSVWWLNWAYPYKEYYEGVSNVVWYADVQSNRVVQYVTQQEFTDQLRTWSLWDSMLQTVSAINSKNNLVWYHTKDVFDVYIETASIQLAWLQQLATFASTYLKDYLLKQLYVDSVDPLTVTTLSKEYAGAAYADGDDSTTATAIGHTESWTEDIYYYDALAILLRIVNDVSESNTTSNTILDLVNNRIKQITALKREASRLRSCYVNDSNIYALESFMRLVSNTYAILNQATTGNEIASRLIQNGIYSYDADVFPITSKTTYDLVQNPATAVWAYLNVLYHVRKYWVKLRFNKQQGSYWQLRSLERVLVFIKASNNAVDKGTANSTKAIPQGKATLKQKDIAFVKSRSAFSERARTVEAATDPTNFTDCVYVKVDYLSLQNPQGSPKWNATTNTYNDKEIVYVPEVYKWAYKPKNGAYYVMSDTLITELKANLAQLNEVMSTIYAKTYTVTSDDIAGIGEDYCTTSDGRTLIEADKTLATIFSSNVHYTADSEQFTEFVNKLLVYKHGKYMDVINKSLYKVWIKWTPAQVWTGLVEDDNKGLWTIDEYQKEVTDNVTRHTQDLAGTWHTSTEAISAGITFNVSIGNLNPNTLLSSAENLQTASLIEILCQANDVCDLWRVEIPADMDIPAKSLEENPVLVPAEVIDPAVGELASEEITPSEATVLAGVATKCVSPVLEAGESLLTASSLNSIGKFVDLGSGELSTTDDL